MTRENVTALPDGGDRRATVAVAMSGGVDSSVAAALLVQQGYDVIGLTMHLWTDEKGSEMALNRSSGCCSIGMTRDAKRVAERMGFRHYTLDFSREFHHWVIEDFAGEYIAGRTPNPCVRCNTYVKWQTLLDRARRLGCDFLATGHYARTGRADGRITLRQAVHREKDQSYALWGLSQDSLSHTIFPLGELTKSEVRRIASELELASADRPESQDICFVPDDDYRRFLKENFGTELAVIQPGDVIGPDGELMGSHSGVAYYTVGQRKGLGISADRPLYISRIDPQSNRIFLDDDENCVSSLTFVHDVNWVSIERPTRPVHCKVKVRYRDSAHEAVLVPFGEETARIDFARPVRAVTPGQSAVFYAEDEVLGGGIISSHQPSGLS